MSWTHAERDAFIAVMVKRGASTSVGETGQKSVALGDWTRRAAITFEDSGRVYVTYIDRGWPDIKAWVEGGIEAWFEIVRGR